MKRVGLLLALLVVLVAFAQSEGPSLEETISTLQEGVTNIPLDAALANIEGWREVLESSDDTTQKIVGSQLGDLAVALQNDPINPEEVGRLLIRSGKARLSSVKTRGRTS